jgi:electron transport complex protein RnfG
MIKLGVVLMLFAGIFAGILAFVNNQTKPIIAANAASEQQIAYREVLPGEEYLDITADNEALLQDYGTVTSIVKVNGENNTLKGYIINVAPRGYSSNLVTLVGINDVGEIVAVKVISQNETPGLGTHVQAPWFQDQFKGLTADDKVAMKQDGGALDAITASTISSRAVALGASEALQLHRLLQNN